MAFKLRNEQFIAIRYLSLEIAKLIISNLNQFVIDGAKTTKLAKLKLSSLEVHLEMNMA